MKKAVINVRDYDFYDREYNVHAVEKMLTAEDMERLSTLTPEYLLSYLRENVVGKMSTSRSNDNYFVPEIKMCGFEISIQTGYYFWDKRDNKRYADGLPLWDQSYHNELITAEEFDSLYDSPGHYVDIRIVLDGKRITCGQMTIIGVANFFYDIVYGLSADIDYAC